MHATPITSPQRRSKLRFLTSCLALLCLLGAGATRAPGEPAAPRQAPVEGEGRRPADDAELRSWLENMVWHHRFDDEEVAAATSLSPDEVRAARRRLSIELDNRPELPADGPLRVLPYPGGRHPRIGFLDGAVRPQRETKVSVFTPWDRDSYVVVDVPEAIWSDLGLTYLAHTHVPTVWSKQGIELPRQEWRHIEQGVLRSERTLPNGIAFGAEVHPGRDAVRMTMWLRNGSDQIRSDLRVQNCVMLKGARGFEQQSNDNKLLRDPYVACRDASGSRWIITAWTPCHRPWANPPCPCLHSDPKFPDCPPGETRRLRGWLSFYEGTDIDGELARIDATGWRTQESYP